MSRSATKKQAPGQDGARSEALDPLTSGVLQIEPQTLSQFSICVSVIATAINQRHVQSRFVSRDDRRLAAPSSLSTLDPYLASYMLHHATLLEFYTLPAFAVKI